MEINSVTSSAYIRPSSNIAFRQRSIAEKQESFELQHHAEDKINVKTGTLAFTDSAKLRRKEQADTVHRCAQKINNYLIDKGYSPCNDFLISNIAVNNLGNIFKSSAGARYLKNLNTIAITPASVDEGDETCEMLILHEQGHYLHHKKLSEAGLNFEPAKLLPEEKEIIKKSYIKLFGNQYNEAIDETIDKCYLENTLEFVGWYFTFKNRGCDFGEDVDKIYQKYYGP